MTTTTRTTARSLMVLLLALAVAAPLALAPADAQAETSTIADEALRQVEFARTELEAGEYERAHKSAASALRLDPTRFEAMMLLGLALEGEGEAARAEALLRTYIDLQGPRALPQAKVALDRLTGEETVAAVTEPAPKTQTR